MDKRFFWLDDLQWSSIKGFLPSRKRRGPRREDDRRIISGIIHVLQSGNGIIDAPKAGAQFHKEWWAMGGSNSRPGDYIPLRL